MEKNIPQQHRAISSGLFAAFVSLTPGLSQSPLLLSVFSANPNLPDFVNGLFTLAISIGAILAVLRIVYAGYLYMGAADMWGSITKAKEVFSDAIIGLLLLLGTWLILSTINPQIVTLSIVQPAVIPILPQQQQPNPTPTCDMSSYFPDTMYFVAHENACAAGYDQVPSSCGTSSGVPGIFCALKKGNTKSFINQTDIPFGQWCYTENATAGGAQSYQCAATENLCTTYAQYAQQQPGAPLITKCTQTTTKTYKAAPPAGSKLFCYQQLTGDFICSASEFDCKTSFSAYPQNANVDPCKAY